MQQPYGEAIAARLHEGMTIIDIGAGRNPTLAVATRPSGTTYIGLDISRSEMNAAGPGAYDEMYAVDITTRVSSLVERADLAVSWQVFEHVKPLDAALDNVHCYLRPGGTLISTFSGKWSAFGILNTIVPNAIGHRVVERVMKRREINEPVFPAFYHRCSARQVRKMTAGWQSVELIPHYRGATYFNFSAVLTRMYLWYEERARARDVANLATHYLLIACK
jgi:cyclopropane fatty-acyl-phospholipid synthase-like methyltransferase